MLRFVLFCIVYSLVIYIFIYQQIRQTYPRRRIFRFKHAWLKKIAIYIYIRYEIKTSLSRLQDMKEGTPIILIFVLELPLYKSSCENLFFLRALQTYLSFLCDTDWHTLHAACIYIRCHQTRCRVGSFLCILRGVTAKPCIEQTPTIECCCWIQ